MSTIHFIPSVAVRRTNALALRTATLNNRSSRLIHSITRFSTISQPRAQYDPSPMHDRQASVAAQGSKPSRHLHTSAIHRNKSNAPKAEDLTRNIDDISHDGSSTPSSARGPRKSPSPGTSKNAESPSGPFRRSGYEGGDGDGNEKGKGKPKTETRMDGDYHNVSRDPGEEYEPPTPKEEEKEQKGTYGGLNKKPGVQ